MKTKRMTSHCYEEISSDSELISLYFFRVHQSCQASDSAS